MTAASSDRAAARNVAAILVERAATGGWLDRVAYHDTERAWSHAALHDLAARTATALARRGVGKDARIGLVARDSVGWVAVFLAAARLGATVVMVNPALTGDEHDRIVRECDARLLVADDSAPRIVGCTRVPLDDLVEEATACAPHAPVEPVTDAHPLYVQYTSGTTGLLKGAVHRHGDLPVFWRTAGDHAMGMTPADVGFSASKMYFAYGFGNSVVYPLFSGASAVIEAARPEPARTAALVARHGVTLLWGVPSMYARLVAETGPESFGTVRLAVSAGESLRVPLGEAVAGLVRATVLDGLGSTEIGGFCAMQTPDCRPAGTVGRALPGYELVVRDENDAEVPVGAEGRLWVRGPTITPGYVARPEETHASIRDGWLVTNDRVSLDERGALRMHGRTDDLEMVGGIAVAPAEVESQLLRHPSVSELAVAAVPDERGATKLRAFAVAAPTLDEAGREAAGRELLELARCEFAPYKVPRTVTWVERLPRTPTGKLQRFRLRTGTW